MGCWQGVRGSFTSEADHHVGCSGLTGVLSLRALAMGALRCIREIVCPGAASRCSLGRLSVPASIDKVPIGSAGC